MGTTRDNNKDFRFPEGCKISFGDSRDRFLLIARESGINPLDLCGYRSRGECEVSDECCLINCDCDVK